MNGKSEKDSNNLLCNKRSRGAVKWVEYQLGNTELDSKQRKEVRKQLCTRKIPVRNSAIVLQDKG